MARPLRETAAGATYHVTARGNRRQLVFADDDDRGLFLRIAGNAVATHRLSCLAYCLLTNHFHLLVQTPQAGTDLSQGMQRLNGRYAQWFNQRHGLDGHLFQGRFNSKLIEGDGHLLATLRYIFRNPIEADLCAAPEDWAWSSYAATIGRVAPPPWVSWQPVLGLFGANPRRATELLAGFVAS